MNLKRPIIFGLGSLFVGAAMAADDVPLPRERPASAGLDVAALVPSACRLRLETIAQVTPLPPRVGPGSCGGVDMVRLSAVKLPDNNTVAVNPPAELRCEMATTFSDWVREDAAPKFAPARLTAIANYDSYDCRGRNRIAGAKISEHGKGNALDVRGFMVGGKFVSPVDYKVSHELRDSLKQSACSRFSTILGPGSDGYHEFHIHFDIAERRSKYRFCQWEVRDKPVEIATVVPLPRARPYDTTGRAGETVKGE